MRECFLCGSTYWLERHHVFYGNPNRELSEKYGLVVDLCHFCHNEPPFGVHFNHENDLKLKRIFQQRFEDEHPGLSFIEIFGKNYL
jgi:hypothetical protein